MASASASASGAPSTVVPGKEEAYVKLDLKLINFSFLPIILRVRTSTPLFMVKRHLVERHGRLAELHIYRGAVSAENELSDDNATLEDYGIVGKRDTEELDTVQLLYNFVPYEHTDALLLATHNRERVGVSS